MMQQTEFQLVYPESPKPQLRTKRKKRKYELCSYCGRSIAIQRNSPHTDSITCIRRRRWILSRTGYSILCRGNAHGFAFEKGKPTPYHTLTAKFIECKFGFAVINPYIFTSTDIFLPKPWVKFLKACENTIQEQHFWESFAILGKIEDIYQPTIGVVLFKRARKIITKTYERYPVRDWFKPIPLQWFISLFKVHLEESESETERDHCVGILDFLNKLTIESNENVKGNT